MIEIVSGDVLNIQKGIIVHGCNTQGVMGAGIALQIRIRYPGAYRVYMDEGRAHGFRLGDISVAEVEPDKFIVNAITQDNIGRKHGRRLVSYDAIADCFEKVALFADQVEKANGRSYNIVFPQIGAGLGFGNWPIIEKIIDTTVPDKHKKILYLYTK